MRGPSITALYEGTAGSMREQDEARELTHWTCGAVSGNDVLSVGCGHGLAAVLLGREGRRVTGLDRDAAVLEAARGRLKAEEEPVQQRVRFQLGEAHALPFERESFDTVLLGDLPAGLMDPGRALAEARRVLRPDGRLVLDLPYGDATDAIEGEPLLLGGLLELLYPDFAVIEFEPLGGVLGVVARPGGDERADAAVLSRALEAAERRVLGLAGDWAAERAADRTEPAPAVDPTARDALVGELRERIGELEERATGAREEREGMSRALQDDRRRLIRFEVERDGAVVERDRLGEALGRAEQALREAEQRREALEQRVRELEADAARIGAEHEQLAAERAKLAQQLESERVAREAFALREAEFAAVAARSQERFDAAVRESAERVRDLEAARDAAERRAQEAERAAADAEAERAAADAGPGHEELTARLDQTAADLRRARRQAAAMRERLQAEAEQREARAAAEVGRLEAALAQEREGAARLRTERDEVARDLTDRAARLEAERRAALDRLAAVEEQRAGVAEQHAVAEAALAEQRAALAEQRAAAEAALAEQREQAEAAAGEAQAALAAEREAVARLGAERDDLAGRLELSERALDEAGAAHAEERSRLRDVALQHQQQAQSTLGELEALRTDLRSAGAARDERAALAAKLEQEVKRLSGDVVAREKLAREQASELHELRVEARRQIAKISRLERTVAVQQPQVQALASIRSGRAYVLMRVLWRINAWVHKPFRRGSAAELISGDESPAPALPEAAEAAPPAPPSGTPRRAAFGTGVPPRPAPQRPGRPQLAPPPPPPTAPKAPRTLTTRQRYDQLDVEADRRRFLAGILIPAERRAPSRLADVRVAGVLGEHLAAGVAATCELVTFRPDTWPLVLEAKPPHLLLVESTFAGNQRSWQHRVAETIHPDTRGLDALVEHCRAEGVPTAFWLTRGVAEAGPFLRALYGFDRVFVADPMAAGPVAEALGDGTRVTPLPVAGIPLAEGAAAPRREGVVFAGRRPASGSPRLDALLDAARPHGLRIVDERGARALPPRFAACVQDRPGRAVRMEALGAAAVALVGGPERSGLVPPEAYDAAAAGAAIVTLAETPLPAGFEAAVATAAGPEQAGELIAALLADEERRAGLARAAREALLAQHTYAHRMAAAAAALGLEVPAGG